MENVSKPVRQRKYLSDDRFILLRIRRYRKSMIYKLKRYDISLFPNTFLLLFKPWKIASKQRRRRRQRRLRKRRRRWKRAK